MNELSGGLVPDMTSEETVRKHLSRHINELTIEVSKLEVAVTKLDDLRSQLERAGRALAAFNETHPSTSVATFGCGYCERAFSSQRGLSRHVGSAHKERLGQVTGHPAYDDQ